MSPVQKELTEALIRDLPGWRFAPTQIFGETLPSTVLVQPLFKSWST